MEKEQASVITAYSGKQVKILEAAERLFAAGGFEGTSVRNVAQEAGINVAMISYYFGSKEKMLEALFVHRMNSGRLMLESMVEDKTISPMDKLFRLIDSYVDKMIDNQHFYRVMMREQLTQEAFGVSTLIQDMKLRNRHLIEEIIRQGQRQKIFVKSIDVPLMMSTIVGTLYQVLASKTMFCGIYHLENQPEEQLNKTLKKKLKAHLQQIFKSILTHE